MSASIVGGRGRHRGTIEILAARTRGGIAAGALQNWGHDADCSHSFEGCDTVARGGQEGAGAGRIEFWNYGSGSNSRDLRSNISTRSKPVEDRNYGSRPPP